MCRTHGQILQECSNLCLRRHEGIEEHLGDVLHICVAVYASRKMKLKRKKIAFTAEVGGEGAMLTQLWHVTIESG